VINKDIPNTQLLLLLVVVVGDMATSPILSTTTTAIKHIMAVHRVPYRSRSTPAPKRLAWAHSNYRPYKWPQAIVPKVVVVVLVLVRARFVDEVLAIVGFIKIST
jgi:hypothetical protein